ncbi:acetylornithine deacetylase [Microdochium trichocladiopsis]|uniref:Acetylornithine deacetylase n=1 Tax=Microdochium trichocladiopsis TaxID=1682393 RepID=A0A9P8Y078_9PEZI|nr:acetylornithine deacetylase [Microdochium trichocladiopsis]KAH7027388.1 acetylornithine deacetylase [Microdochium trichocladiopsis]
MQVLTAQLLLASSLAQATVAWHEQIPLGGVPEILPVVDKALSYRDDLVSLHKSLVDIQSISFDESEVGQFLVDYLTERDFVVYKQFLPTSNKTASGPSEDDKARFNVVAWPGSRGPRPFPKVLVTSHIDTVPPFIPYLRSDHGRAINGETVIAGRGSVDAKASVAAQIIAVFELLEAEEIEREDDVMLLFVVGEERSGDGMRVFSDAVARRDPPLELRAAIFGEPTEGKLACGHKGFFDCEITVHGKAGHSGYPWLGKSANEVLMRALTKVLDTDLGSSEEYGNTTVNVGLLQGGVAPNVIPEKATSKIAGRVAIGPQDGGSQIVVDRLIDVLKSVDEEGIEYQCYTGYGVVKCECDVDGFETAVMNYGTDVANFRGTHTKYLYGPGSILVAHGPDEALKLKDMEDAVEGYKKLILHALGN